MLTAELNDKLSRVGPGTPCGELLRRYWHPIAVVTELKRKPTKKVRLLGEDLVLFKDSSGSLGLIEERCAHRRVSLSYGIPEPAGLRCPYHGWLYDASGKCLEQPAEPVSSTFKDRIRLQAYPVEELGGLVFAYLGPQPAPLLPRYEAYARDNAVRLIGVTTLPCNWLQVMENSLDATHVEWLHGYYSDYVQAGVAAERGLTFHPRRYPHHVKIGFDVFEHGIVKRRVEEGGSEEDDDWRIGHPVVFPCILGSPSQIRVPMDDTHTWHLWYTSTPVGVPVPPEAADPFVFELPWEDGGPVFTDFTNGQDIMAWVTQGDSAERHLERLGASDVGIILYRDLLKEQIERVERGEDPMEVYRDPAHNQMILLPRERVKHVARLRADGASESNARPGTGGGAASAFYGYSFYGPDERLDAESRRAMDGYRRWVPELRARAAADGIEAGYPEPPVVAAIRGVVANMA